MTDRMPGEDPGWGPLGKVVLGLFLPWLAVRRAASASSNALVTLRSVFVAFALAQVLIGVVVLFLVGGAEGDPEVEPAVAAGAVLAIGLVLVLGSRTLLRELPCADLGQLVGAYRTRFFLRIAFAESSTLLGFVGSLLSDSALPYLAGLLPAAIGFARLAPTRPNLQREDDALLAQGCPHSLYGALAQATLGPPSGPG